jgi:predicted permease
MQTLWQDFRYAVRTLLRSPILSLVIVVSLAIGIGANTAIFSVVNALLLKPLPYPDPDRLAVLWLRSPGINIPQDWPSPGQYIDIKTENSSFQEMSLSRGRTATFLGREQPERVEVLQTTSSLFRLLGAQPIHGRLLIAEDDVPGHAQVVVLSYNFWRRLLDADPSVVGRSITLNGMGAGTGDDRNQYVVAGVLAPDFLLNEEVMPTVASIRQMDVFLPLPLGADAVNRRGDENFNIMARLKPGVTMEQAQVDVSVTAARIREKDKRDQTFTISVVPLLDQVVGNVRRAVMVLFGSVGLVLVIACANVANLLLTRASGRQKEMAIRTALGAGWRRVVRQLLTESLLLAMIGAAVGLAIAEVQLYLVRTINPGNIPRLDAIAIDRSVLAFTFVTSIATSVLFGLAPALRATRIDLNTTLKAGGRSAQGDVGFNTSRRQLRSLLVVGEVALSLMLLIGAGLLIRSFVRLQSVSPGFNPDSVISMRMGASSRRLTEREAALSYSRELSARISRVPGVVMRGAVSSLPFTSAVGWGSINVEGFTPQPGQELQVDQRAASPDYFRTMQIPLLQGRMFTELDSTSDQGVAIIDESFAQRFWPNGDALGKRLWFDPKRPIVIVGVVGTVKQYGLDVDGRIVTYYPAIGPLPYHVARTQSNPDTVAAAVVREIHAFDPTIPVYDIQTMTARMRDSMARQRFAMLMLGGFALFALLLAAVGVYGVMSHLVNQGTRDIGLRMALGAERGQVQRMVMRQGIELTAAGVVIGLAGAAALTRLMASLLFGVTATDAVTFSVIPALLAIIALAASYLPARRAMYVDPVVALRDE